MRATVSNRPGLIILNLALASTLIVLAVASRADGQNASGPPARARGEYTLVAGKSNSGGSDVVYVVDASNQEIVALKWDQSRQAMTAVGYRSMGADQRQTPGR
ncbi:MAG: hypothetical protein IT433_07310 [Phycisphaerales bacterium]|nr:hypothetical protein [Phycisphaerales bacterium]